LRASNGAIIEMEIVQCETETALCTKLLSIGGIVLSIISICVPFLL
jgi:hypothetical protein